MVPRDVYGDTVNVAARLQVLAEPGGISISTGVRDAVRGKFDLEFENRGELNVKNIPDPVGTFNVIFDPIAWTTGRDEPPPEPRTRRSRNLFAAGAVLLDAAIVGAGWYLLGSSPRSPALSSWKEGLSARMASAVPALGGKALENAVRAYEAGQTHKAQVASPDPPGLWRSFGRPTAENAETAALENCQINYGRRCALMAVDDTLQPISADAAGLAGTCRGPGIPAASSRHKFRERHQPFAIGRTLSITEPHRLPRQPPSPRSAVAFLRLSGRPANARQRRRASMLALPTPCARPRMVRVSSMPSAIGWSCRCASLQQ
jgi:hypothetical protein